VSDPFHGLLFGHCPYGDRPAQAAKSLLSHCPKNGGNFTRAFGFELSRVHGSHHIFEHPDIPEILNLQNYKGEAKPYQIEQFLALVEEYNLTIKEDAS
jgi:hypothetical protein